MSNETDRATPRPWRVVWSGSMGRDSVKRHPVTDEPYREASMISGIASDNPEWVKNVAHIYRGSGDFDASLAEQAANAALIVRAVNAHEKLVEALQGMTVLAAELLRRGEGAVYSPETNGYMQSARAALALAREGKP